MTKLPEVLTPADIRSIRPGAVPPPVPFEEMLRRKAAPNLAWGKPLAWGMLA